MDARYFIKLEDNKVKCTLCPHNCIIQENKEGICKVRKNESGKLISQNYGVVSSIGFDPVEKKPLYHFYPGSEILSIGSLGCNLKCKFCQNWQISQSSIDDFDRSIRTYDPKQIIDIAETRKTNIGIAYTYNEPTVFFEFMNDTAILANDQGLKNVMISNGFINPAPLKELMKYMDAFNIDLKAFNEQFYKKYTKAGLNPVKKTLKTISEYKKHLEITNLVIPGLNDDPAEFEKMMQWISNSLNNNVVVHISRYYPSYKMEIDATSLEKMLTLEKIAKKYVDFVYLGNVLIPEGNNTYCKKCNELLIRRSGYTTKNISIKSDGTCMKCGTQVLTYI